MEGDCEGIIGPKPIPKYRVIFNMQPLESFLGCVCLEEHYQVRPFTYRPLYMSTTVPIIIIILHSTVYIYQRWGDTQISLIGRSRIFDERYRNRSFGRILSPFFFYLLVIKGVLNKSSTLCDIIDVLVAAVHTHRLNN